MAQRALMGQSVSSIRDLIQTDALRGKVIDVDAYTRFFQPLFPDLTSEQIRQEITATVCSFSGSAVWGMDELKFTDEDGTRPTDRET